MRKSLFVLCLLCLIASVALAQSNKVANSWTCPKPAVAHSLDVGDKPHHTYSIAQFKCTATKGEMGGVKDKEGAGTEFDDVSGTSVSGHGVFVETLANGDKLHFTYQTTSTTAKNGAMQSGQNKWEITEGTGKFKGAKGSGGCTGKAGANGAADWACNGSYTISK